MAAKYKPQIVNCFHMLDPRPTEGPIKSPLSVRPSVRHFFQEWVISFFYFFCTLVDNWNMEKLTEASFLRKF